MLNIEVHNSQSNFSYVGGGGRGIVKLNYVIYGGESVEKGQIFSK